ncbi:NTP transferase domain-containing protein [Catenulispora subtropica]|uniref:Molybdopterin-guanine dinucleotide biosynthesis protein n=1 Tax=Catenulispora subtropica TaxID=450798 RepID=A0ABP5C9X4_9ACTN
MDPADPAGEPFDAIVLAGGDARRLGGVDKPGLDVGGISLLDRVVAACAGARTITVVGPARAVRHPVEFTREDPPGGGPVPALAAGMEIGSSEVVAVFAADLPFLDAAAVELLRRSLTADAVVFTDVHGKDQPLAAVYRRRALAEALAAVPELPGARLFSILRTLTVTRVPDPGGVTADCDTWDALHAARALLATRPAAPTKMDGMDDDKLLADWCAAAAAELGLASHELSPEDLNAILGLAGVAAHSVKRPAAPLTTFLAGYAVGLRSSAGGGRGALDGPIAKLSALAQAWGQNGGQAARGHGATGSAGAGAGRSAAAGAGGSGGPETGSTPADSASVAGSVAERAAGSGPTRATPPGGTARGGSAAGSTEAESADAESAAGDASRSAGQ